ncbi:type II secretion system F family protein [Methanohalophilus halophilus]|nr:type II secretion system F family protein [Methanohalophilus halophilus]APH39751.1 hypothetical protein BHR79_09850 [Methanohalophilus halophilus]SDW38804.1 flagellar protein FlaJ [Methanohalophilus halophilus]
MNLEKYKLQVRRYWQMIIFRYDIRREYFTIGIPVLLAFLLLASALFAGHALPMGGSDSSSGSLADLPVEEREKLAKELAAKIEEAEAAGENADIDMKTLLEEKTTPKKKDLDHIIIYALLIAIIPFAIDTFIQKKKLRQQEIAFSEFLFKMAELMRGGIDPVKAVIDLSKSDLGAIDKPIKNAATKLVLGHPFEYAMEGVAEELKSKLVSKYNNVIVQAAYTGGNVADLMQRTSEDMRAVIGIEREKEGNLKQYVVIFYLAQGVIVLLIYLLSTSLLPMIQGAGSEALGSDAITNIDFQLGFFHLIMINATFGGLIIGQISEGDIKHGFKHTAVLVVVSYLACTSLILPAGPADSYSIELVSGGNQKLPGPGMPVTDPLVFSVKDQQGNPAENITVEFSISPPSGHIAVNKTTNSNGTVSVAPTLGKSDGWYTIEAKAGISKATASVKAGY